MFVVMRAITWSALFIGFVLVVVPARMLESAGVTRPPELGVAQVAGAGLVALGGALALWCIWTFARVGRGTPAVFDPPRRLVVSGPYRYLRNPMYAGAALALGGAALFYGSVALAGYALGFLVVTHAFACLYEEPTLRARFGTDYADYCRNVRRWWPRRPTRSG